MLELSGKMLWNRGLSPRIELLVFGLWQRSGWDLEGNCRINSVYVIWRQGKDCWYIAAHFGIVSLLSCLVLYSHVI